MAGSGMSSSISGWSLRWPIVKTWLTAGAGSARPSGTIQSSSGVRHLSAAQQAAGHQSAFIAPSPMKGVTSRNLAYRCVEVEPMGHAAMVDLSTVTVWIKSYGLSGR